MRAELALKGESNFVHQRKGKARMFPAWNCKNTWRTWQVEEISAVGSYCILGEFAQGQGWQAILGHTMMADYAMLRSLGLENPMNVRHFPNLVENHDSLSVSAYRG